MLAAGQWDVFICYAGEDRRHVAQPVYDHLVSQGISCWYDQGEVLWGDSILAKIDEGLGNARFVLVILSTSSVNKNVPKAERYSALSQELESDETRVLPLLVGNDDELREVRRLVPLGRDKRYLRWTGNADVVGEELLKLLRRDSANRLSSSDEGVTPSENGREEPLRLVASFPEDNQEIAVEDVRRIFLEFSKPVDKESVKYIGNYHVRTDTFCQWDRCGWIQYAEDDTKLIWHVKERALQNEDNFGAIDIDYHTFEIHLGRPPDEWRVRATDGSVLPRTTIRVKIRNDV